jgi:hypothetical protein
MQATSQFFNLLRGFLEKSRTFAAQNDVLRLLRCALWMRGGMNVYWSCHEQPERISFCNPLPHHTALLKIVLGFEFWILFVFSPPLC